MSDEINHFRRRLCGTAAMTLAAAPLGIFDTTTLAQPQMHTSFARR